MSLFKLVMFLMFATLLASCVATQTFPGVVRAGDTITLAVGSLDGLNRSNITVEYYPDSDPNNPITLTQNVRSVIKLFPDKTSEAYWDRNGLETANYLSYLSGHGPWQSVVAIDLPVTLPVGTGYFRVTPGAGVSYPITLTIVKVVDIAMEVLPAIGGPHSFEYRLTQFNTDTSIGDITKLEGLRQVVVNYIPDGFSSPVLVAGAEYNVSLNVFDQFQNDVTSQMQSSDFAVILDDQPSYARNQTNLIWSRNGNNFKVIVTNSTGNENYRSLRFSILLANLEQQAINGWTISQNPAVTNHKYYDINGDQIFGLLAPNVIVTN